jgi:hypothetical protein
MPRLAPVIRTVLSAMFNVVLAFVGEVLDGGAASSRG